ncbi:MAG: hypothetical protein FWF77_05195 [Defluviitaleaceae bacterium]|nr:hypothetical protein [Defluviitaleaceae bacterium]
MSEATHSLEAGSSFPKHKKNESASDTRRLIFFRARRHRQISPLHLDKPTAYGTKSALRRDCNEII